MVACPPGWRKVKAELPGTAGGSPQDQWHFVPEHHWDFALQDQRDFASRNHSSSRCVCCRVRPPRRSPTPRIRSATWIRVPLAQRQPAANSLRQCASRTWERWSSAAWSLSGVCGSSGCGEGAEARKPADCVVSRLASHGPSVRSRPFEHHVRRHRLDELPGRAGEGQHNGVDRRLTLFCTSRGVYSTRSATCVSASLKVSPL